MKEKFICDIFRDICSSMVYLINKNIGRFKSLLKFIWELVLERLTKDVHFDHCWFHFSRENICWFLNKKDFLVAVRLYFRLKLWDFYSRFEWHTSRTHPPNSQEIFEIKMPIFRFWLVLTVESPPSRLLRHRSRGAWWASQWKWTNMYPLLLFQWPFAIHHSNTWQKWGKMSLWRFNYRREGERCLSMAAANWMGYLQNKLVFEVLAGPNRSEGGTR